MSSKAVAKETPFSAVPATVPGNQQDLGFDLNTIPEDVRPIIATQIRRVRDSMRRTTIEILEIGRALTDIRETIQEGLFTALIRAEFHMDPRVARRFMQAARFVDEHMPGNEARIVEHLSPTVLYQLAQGDISVEIVQAVLENNQNGKQLMPADIRKAMSDMQLHVDHLNGELAETTGALSATKAELHRITEHADKNELAAARYKEQVDRLSRNLTNSQQDISQMSSEQAKFQEEIDTLRRQLANPPTRQVEKEIVPPGFRSLTEAIAAKEKELRAITSKKSSAEEDLIQTHHRLATLQGDLATTEAGANTLSAFRSDVQSLCAKYPAAYVIASANDDPRVTVECTEIAEYLRRLADQIEAKAPAKRRKS